MDAKFVWKTYGKIIEKELNKATADDIKFYEQKFDELITKHKTRLRIK